MGTSLSGIESGGNPWVSGSTYTQWAIVISPANGQPYIRTAAAGSGTTDPSADASNWRLYGGVYKSIQRVQFVVNGTSGTATISAVDTSRCELRNLGAYQNNTNSACTFVPSLVNSTTVQATFGLGGVNATVAIEILEHY